MYVCMAYCKGVSMAHPHDRAANPFLFDPKMASVVSIALGASWAARSWDAATTRSFSNLAQFQQRQLQQKEQKLLHMLESQTERTIQRVSRGSAGSANSSTSSITSSTSTGKVRQMFEERRSQNPASPSRVNRGGRPTPATTGIDRSYPLVPLTRAAPARAPLLGPSSAGRPTPLKTTPLRASKTQAGEQDVFLRPLKATTLYRDTNTNRAPGKDEDSSAADISSAAVFGKLANVGSRSSFNNNDEDDVTSNGFSSSSGPGPGQRNNKPVLAEVSRRPVKEVETPVRPKLGQLKKIETKSTVQKSSVVPTPARHSSPLSPSKSSGGSRSGGSSSVTSPVSTTAARSAASSPKTKVTTTTAVQKKMTYDTPPPEGMADCTLCGRRFAEERVAKHEEICRKTSTKKRKVFDPVKMRVQGTEVEAYVKKASKSKKPEVANKENTKKNNWRKKHEEFINTIRQAKLVTQHLEAGGKLSDLPPPPPMDTSDYVQCPHCNRKFAEAAAERHIPRCQNIKSNKPAPRKR